MKNFIKKSKLFFLFASMACFIISGCSNSRNNENTDVEKITVADTNVFGYSLAYLFTGEEKYLKIASDAVDFLLEHAWDKEYGGNSKCVTLNEIK